MVVNHISQYIAGALFGRGKGVPFSLGCHLRILYSPQVDGRVELELQARKRGSILLVRMKTLAWAERSEFLHSSGLRQLQVASFVQADTS